MSQPIQQYVSKQTFDEVWQELQRMKAETPRIAIIGFNEAYNVGILHDRIRELEAENARLHMKVSDLLVTKVCHDADVHQKKD